MIKQVPNFVLINFFCKEIILKTTFFLVIYYSCGGFQRGIFLQLWLIFMCVFHDFFFGTYLDPDPSFLKWIQIRPMIRIQNTALIPYFLSVLKETWLG